MNSEEKAGFETLLCPEVGDTPTIGMLREYEGLFERFETPGSRCVLYFPSEYVLNKLGLCNINRVNYKVNGIFPCYAIIEGKGDTGGSREGGMDPFATGLSYASEFIIYRSNKSNKGGKKMGLQRPRITTRRSQKRNDNGKCGVTGFEVSIKEGPIKDDVVRRRDIDYNVRSAPHTFYSEGAATYGFAGVAVYHVLFHNGTDPTSSNSDNDCIY